MWTLLQDTKFRERTEAGGKKPISPVCIGRKGDINSYNCGLEFSFSQSHVLYFVLVWSHRHTAQTTWWHPDGCESFITGKKRWVSKVNRLFFRFFSSMKEFPWWWSIKFAAGRGYLRATRHTAWLTASEILRERLTLSYCVHTNYSRTTSAGTSLHATEFRVNEPPSLSAALQTQPLNSEDCDFCLNYVIEWVHPFSIQPEDFGRLLFCSCLVTEENHWHLRSALA